MMIEAIKEEEKVDSQRLNDVLLHFWNAARGEADVPYEKNIDFRVMEPIWDSCFLVHHERINGERVFSYLHLGKELVEAYGGRKEQRDAASLIYPANLSLEKEFRQVVRLKQMQQVANRLPKKNGADILYRSIMLPLLNADGDVAYILGGMRWKFCQ